MRLVRDAIANAVDKQKASVDARGRKNHERFMLGDKVLLSTTGIQAASITNLGANKLVPRFIGPFTVCKVQGEAYVFDIPTTMRLPPTFYVGRLKRYSPAEVPRSEAAPRMRTAVPCTSTPPANSAEPYQPCTPGCQHEWRGSPARDSASAYPSPRGAPRGGPRVETPSQHGRVPAQRRGEPSAAHPPTATAPCAVAPTPDPRQLPALHSGRFERDAPPPLVDSSGNVRWIVYRIVDHRDARRCAPPRHTRGPPRSIPNTREYRVRWLGFPPTSDSWVPRASLREDAPDVVTEYDATVTARADAHAGSSSANENGQHGDRRASESESVSAMTTATNVEAIYHVTYHVPRARAVRGVADPSRGGIARPACSPPHSAGAPRRSPPSRRDSGAARRAAAVVMRVTAAPISIPRQRAQRLGELVSPVATAVAFAALNSKVDIRVLVPPHHERGPRDVEILRRDAESRIDCLTTCQSSSSPEFNELVLARQVHEAAAVV